MCCNVCIACKEYSVSTTFFIIAIQFGANKIPFFIVTDLAILLVILVHFQSFSEKRSLSSNGHWFDPDSLHKLKHIRLYLQRF